MLDIYGYYLNNNIASRDSLSKNYNIFKGIMPTLLELKSSGELIYNKISKEDNKLFSFLQDKVDLIPLIQNFQLNSIEANNFLENINIWDSAIKQIKLYLKKNNFRGINLDIEGIKVKNTDKLNMFIYKLKSYLQEDSYSLDLSLPAKTEKISKGWAAAYNYRILGDMVDRVYIMTYDYHWPGGLSGPIAPLFWLQDIVDFSIMNISLKKIYIALPLYGYDWIEDLDSPARALSQKQIINIIKKEKGRFEWDQESVSPYFEYSNRKGKHIIWFEDSKSLAMKINLIKKYQINGIAFWRIGLENENYFKSLSIK